MISGHRVRALVGTSDSATCLVAHGIPPAIDDTVVKGSILHQRLQSTDLLLVLVSTQQRNLQGHEYQSHSLMAFCGEQSRQKG